LANRIVSCCPLVVTEVAHLEAGGGHRGNPGVDGVVWGSVPVDGGVVLVVGGDEDLRRSGVRAREVDRGAAVVGDGGVAGLEVWEGVGGVPGVRVLVHEGVVVGGRVAVGVGLGAGGTGSC
jgi:hypothetical protein